MSGDASRPWGPGPWDGEPDRVAYEAHGLPIVIERHPDMGHLCGYVGVPPEHPDHGRHRDSLTEDLDVHRGVTFAGPNDERGGMPGVWWIGFDCAHAFDVIPFIHAPRTRELISRRIRARHYKPADVYRDLAYVRAECERLAEQLAARWPS